MGQVLHGSATTTEAVRRAIQLREESVRSLAKRYGVQPDDGAEVAQTDEHCGRPDGPQGAALHRAHR